MCFLLNLPLKKREKKKFFGLSERFISSFSVNLLSDLGAIVIKIITSLAKL
jgi:hypothetical protein